MTPDRWLGGLRSSCVSRVLLLLAASLAAPSTLWAQADAQQKAAAEALFEEGKQLRSRGQFDSACSKFEQSQAIDSAAGTMLYIGECYERQGRSASAWATFRAAASRATAAGQADRARLAEEYASKLSGRLSRLTLVVPAADRDAVGFELLLDGRVLSPALYGVPFPVDPGPHQLLARAPGRNSWSGNVDVGANADHRSLQIPALEATAAAQAPAPQLEPLPADLMIGAPPAPPPPELERRRDHTAGYVVGGAGVAALGIGAIFGLRAAGKDSDAKEFCPSDCVSARGADLNEQARTAALIANISYGVGAAAVLTSAYLLFIAGSGPDSAQLELPGLELAAQLGSAEGTISVSGSF